MKTAYHLYLDETGTFNADDRAAIGGIWAAREITQQEAAEFWNEVLGHPMHETFHANEYRGDLGPIMRRALAAWTARDWQPLLIEHVTRQLVVNNPTTYVNVFAEGISKFGRTRAAGLKGELTLPILAARRMVPREGNQDHLDTMKDHDYRLRLDERMAVERLRVPKLATEATWTYRLDIGSAREDKRLMMADLLCYGWRNPNRIPAELRDTWKSFLESYRYLALRADDAELIELNLERSEYGLALLSLLAFYQDPKRQPNWLAGCRNQVVAHLAAADVDVRDAALQTALSRIHAEVEVRRDFTVAQQLLDAWITEILGPLQAAVLPKEAERLEWSHAQALAYALATCNHRGAIIEAEKYRTALAPLRPKLAGRFERLPLALHIRIIDAVHRSNVYDYEGALTDMETLSDNLEGLLSLLPDMEEAHETPGSDLLGSALGTGLQAAFMAGRRDRQQYTKARALSERALAQFESDQDLQRQAGYRAQLETDAAETAEEFAEARRWLTRAVGVSDDATWPVLLAKAKDNLFNVMHVARLWEAAARHGETALAAELAEAWKEADLVKLPELNDPKKHPAHLILWKWGAALGHMGRETEGIVYLERAIKGLDADAQATTMRTLGLGVRCDRAALLAKTGQANALRKAIGNLQTEVAHVTDERQPPALRAYFAKWPARLDACATPGDWERMAWEIPY